MRSNSTELVFILDRSGSMAGLESDTIGGFNYNLEKPQKVEGEANDGIRSTHRVLLLAGGRSGAAEPITRS